MITIKYNNKINLTFGEVWFLDNIEDFDDNGYDIISYRGYREKIKKGKCFLQHTLILDLTKDEEVLFNDIRKNVKYEINRCEKEEVKEEFFDSESIRKDEKILEEFINMYNDMYKEKNLNTRINYKLVNGYIDSGSFYLTRAVKNETLCYHAYIFDNKETRLLYSCSTYRTGDKEYQNLVARANKFLHWKDIQFFKNKSIKIYDFGGLSSIDNPNGIDKFKMAFGGETKDYYNIVINKTKKAVLYSLLKKFK